jgi:hypothetical protein
MQPLSSRHKKTLMNRRWNVEVLLANGTEFVQLVSMQEVRDRFRELKKTDPKCSINPIEAWVFDIIMEDVAVSFPRLKALSVDIKSV